MPIQNTLGGLEQPLVSVAASKTFNANDMNTFQLCTGSTAMTLTVPADATLNMDVGTEISIAQDGTGAVTISAATNCFVRRIGSTATTGHLMMGQYAVAMLKKVSSNEWRIYGGVSY